MAPLEGSAWGSFCGGEAGSGKLVLGGARLDDGVLRLLVAGHPNHSGIELAVREPRFGIQHTLGLHADPGPVWETFVFRLPDTGNAQPVELIVRDQSGGEAWIAVAQPSTRWSWSPRPMLGLLAGVSFHGLLYWLPGVGVLLALRRLRRWEIDSPIAPIVVGTAALGYLAFWMYWLHPDLGRVYSLLVYGASMSLVGLAIRGRGAAPLRVLLDSHASQAFLLTAALVVFYAFSAFMWGGVDSPFRTVASRYSHTLPLDNVIPMLLADGVYSGEMREPFFFGWRSSDRPPLQAGLFAMQRPLHALVPLSGEKLHYQLAGLWFQATWIPALLWLLRKAGATRGLTTAILLATAASGFALVNTTYVWPKLLPAALLLFPAAALVFGPAQTNEDWRSDAWGGFAGLSAALAMLGHGGSAFALLGMAATALVLRRVPGRRVIAVAIGVAAVTHLPWNLYQGFVDPPGDRLLKVHLAGNRGEKGQSVGELIRSRYASLSAGEIASNKLENFAYLGRGFFGGAVDTLASIAPESSGSRLASVRKQAFHRVFSALGLLNLGWLALLGLSLRRERTGEGAGIAVRALLFFATTVVIWNLLLFGPGTSPIHHGSYATMLAAFVGLVAALYALHPRLAAVAVAAHVALSLVLYASPNASLVAPDADVAVGLAAPDGILVLATLAALLLAGGCALRFARHAR